MNVPQKISRYTVLSEIGRGGMATVYLAEDPLFDRKVAVKVLPGYFVHDEDLRARFIREARIIARLEHPAIISVYDFGEEVNSMYLTMSYMPGGSLHGLMERNKALDHQFIRQIVDRICSALGKAHSKGIIHRDVKPDNILFDEDGMAYLSDFGIAHLTEGTKSSALIGTPSYMSPEQFKNDVQIDRRADLYSLGVVLFELLTGARPYESDTPARIMMMHAFDPIPRLSAFNKELPLKFQDFIDTAMAKNREARFQTATELATAFANLVPAPTIVYPRRAREEGITANNTTKDSLITVTPFFRPRLQIPLLLAVLGSFVFILFFAIAAIWGLQLLVNPPTTPSFTLTAPVTTDVPGQQNTPGPATLGVLNITVEIIQNDTSTAPSLFEPTLGLIPTSTHTPTPVPPTLTPRRTTAPTPTRTNTATFGGGGGSQ